MERGSAYPFPSIQPIPFYIPVHALISLFPIQEGLSLLILSRYAAPSLPSLYTERGSALFPYPLSLHIHSIYSPSLDQPIPALTYDPGYALSLSIYSYYIEGCPDSALHIPLFMILTKYAPTFKETFF